MKKHICKQCNKIYEYCRGCLLSPISYKENGYCSETCYEASKIKVEPIVENVIETPIEDTAPIQEEVSAEIESEAIIEEEAPIVETTTEVEAIIKKETYNTYKNKKNKYKVRE